MSQRKHKSGPTLTPVHDGASAYRYTAFASVPLGSALRSKESLVVSDSAADLVPQDASERPGTFEDEEGNITFNDSPRVETNDVDEVESNESGEIPTEPKAESERGTADGQAAAAVRRLATELFDDFISIGGTDGKGEDAEALALEEARRVPPVLETVPWLESLGSIEAPSLRLHQDIVEMARYLTPYPAEEAERGASIARVKEAVTSIWPEAEMTLFGSFATGLYLPTSDIDVVIMKSGCTDIPSGLRALASALHRRKLAKDVQVIAKARVPIIKFEEVTSGYKFDISFDMANGPQAAGAVKELMEQLPPMRQLVMVLKVFLHQRDLNEVYAGGLGSYALLIAVASFLLLHPSRLPLGAPSRGRVRPQPLEGNLGLLLIDFFRLYGRTLNVYEAGIACTDGGCYYSKSERGFLSLERPYLLSVQDPCDKDNDVGKNSYQISRVRAAFEHAYGMLVAPSVRGESLLPRILRLEPVLFARKPLPHPDEQPGRRYGPGHRRSSSSRLATPEEGRKRKHRERSTSPPEETHPGEPCTTENGRRVPLRRSSASSQHIRFD